jgi:hypothetical protein
MDFPRRYVNHAHAAFADLFEELVAADLGAGAFGKGRQVDGGNDGCWPLQEAAGTLVVGKQLIDLSSKIGIVAARLAEECRTLGPVQFDRPVEHGFRGLRLLLGCRQTIPESSSELSAMRRFPRLYASRIIAFSLVLFSRLVATGAPTATRQPEASAKLVSSRGSFAASTRTDPPRRLTSSPVTRSWNDCTQLHRCFSATVR